MEIKKEIKSDLNKMIIVYEDEDIIIVNKPKNMLTHKTHLNENNTVVDLLKSKININQFNDLTRPGIFMRLDRNTTGLLIVAKNLKAYQYFCSLTEKKQIIKKYLAVIKNRLQENHLLIDCPLIRVANKSKMKVSQDPKAKEAITELWKLKDLNNAALVECLLKTGKMHQIRAHLSYIKHPIYNDSVYGCFDGVKNYEQFLHAYYLDFINLNGDHIIIKSNPDEIFENKIKELEN